MSTERQCMSHSAITDGVEGRRSSVFISRLVLRGHQPEHGCNPRATCACNHPIVGDPWTASPRGAHQTEARVTRRTHANLVSGIKISQSPTEDQQRHSPNHMRPQAPGRTSTRQRARTTAHVADDKFKENPWAVRRIRGRVICF